MNLEAFSKGTLQDVCTILEQYKDKSIDEILGDIKPLISFTEKKNHVVKRRSAKRCPSCKDGILRPACGGRLECKCGYSEEIK